MTTLKIKLFNGQDATLQHDDKTQAWALVNAAGTILSADVGDEYAATMAAKYVDKQTLRAAFPMRGFHA